MMLFSPCVLFFFRNKFLRCLVCDFFPYHSAFDTFHFSMYFHIIYFYLYLYILLGWLFFLCKFPDFSLRAWFNELRKKRMEDLRQALELSEDSIGLVIWGPFGWRFLISLFSIVEIHVSVL